jgi:hypothetical protein
MMKAGAEVCLRPQERRAFFCCGALGAIGTSLANTLMIAIATKLMVLITALFSQPRSADGDGPGCHFRPGPQLAEWIKLSYAAPRGKKPNHLLRHA